MSRNYNNVATIGVPGTLKNGIRAQHPPLAWKTACPSQGRLGLLAAEACLRTRGKGMGTGWRKKCWKINSVGGSSTKLSKSRQKPPSAQASTPTPPTLPTPNHHQHQHRHYHQHQHEYDQNNQMWYSGTPEYHTRVPTRVRPKQPDYTRVPPGITSGTFPSMTKTTRFYSRVPSSIIPGYLPEYDENNQIWYSGTPEYHTRDLPEYDQNNQIW